jgi:hypothetical protein
MQALAQLHRHSLHCSCFHWLQALGPRAIPTAAAVEEELRRLRLEDGRPPDDCSSEDEEAVARGRQQTALAKDPADYFGFVG